MDIYSKKYQIIEWITNLRDTQMIDKLFRISEKSDWWADLSEAERHSIEKGLRDISANKVLTHSEVKKRYEKYL